MSRAPLLQLPIDSRTVAFTAIDGALNVAGPQLPKNELAAQLKGDARVDLRGEVVRLKLAGKLAGTAVRAQLASTGFAAPVYTFDVKLDELNLDDYVADASDAREKSAPVGEASFLKALAQIPATGTFTIGVLKSADVKANDVRFEIK